MRSDTHYDLYETRNEKDNRFKGLLFMVVFFSGSIGIVHLVIYLFA